MGFCSRTTTQSWLFFLRVVVKTASAFLLASTLVFTFELPLFAEDGPSCVLNGVEKEIKEEKIRLSVQFKSGIETLKTLSPEVVAGNQTPTWQDFEALQNVVSSFKAGRKNLKNRRKVDQLDRTLQFITNSLKSDAQIQAIRDAKLKSHPDPYFPGEYGLKLAYQQLVREANDVLPPDLRLPSYQLKLDDRTPGLIRQGHAAIVKQEKRLASLLVNTGFKTLKGLRTALDQFSPVSKQLAKDIDEENVEFAMNRPEGTRWWAPKTGFQNQFATGSSSGGYDVDYRNEVESKAMGIPVEDYKVKDAEFKPNYGYLRPKIGSGMKQADSASGYGSDTYIFKPEVVRDYLTFTSGDSYGLDKSGDAGKPSSSWRSYFIPWKFRLTIVPDLIESAKSNLGFEAREFKTSDEAPPEKLGPEPEAPPAPEPNYPDYPEMDFPTQPDALTALIEPMPPEGPGSSSYGYSSSSSYSSSHYSSYSSSSSGGMGGSAVEAEMSLGQAPRPPLIPPLKRGQTFKAALDLYHQTPAYREFAKKMSVYRKAAKAQAAKIQEQDAINSKKYEEARAAYEATPEYQAYLVKHAEYQKEYDRLQAEFQASEPYKKYAASMAEADARNKAVQDQYEAKMKVYKKTPAYREYRKKLKAWNDAVKAQKNALEKSERYRWYSANKKIDPSFRPLDGPRLNQFRVPTGWGFIELQYWRPLGMEHVQKFIFTKTPPSGDFLQSLLENHIEIRDARTDKDNPPLWQPSAAELKIAQQRAVEHALEAPAPKHP